MHGVEVRFETVDMDKLNTDMLAVGGRLKSYIDAWKRITSDMSIIEAISGYKIKFCEGQPPQTNAGATPLQTEPT